MKELEGMESFFSKGKLLPEQRVCVGGERALHELLKLAKIWRFMYGMDLKCSPKAYFAVTYLVSFFMYILNNQNKLIFDCNRNWIIMWNINFTCQGGFLIIFSVL